MLWLINLIQIAFVISEKVQFSYKNGYYFVNLKVGSEKKELKLVLDILISNNIIASENCENCSSQKYPADEIKENILISSNISLKKNYQIFTGDLYSNIFFLSKDPDIINYQATFLNFHEFKYLKNFDYTGYLSLSFSNQRLKSSFKYFSLIFQQTKGNIYFNEINQDYTINKTSGNYSVYFTDFNQDNSTNQIWYIKSSNFSLVTVNQEEQKVEEKFINESASIIFDITGWDIYIPKKFFFSHIEDIFSSEKQCQEYPSGVFLCECSSRYPSISFSFDDQPNITVTPNDYLTVETISFGSNQCVAHMKINYDNDYWIFGVNVLNNYYSIFDLENSTIRLYKAPPIESSQTDFIITILLVVGFSCFALYALYSYVMLKIANRRRQREESEIQDGDSLLGEE